MRNDHKTNKHTLNCKSIKPGKSTKTIKVKNYKDVNRYEHIATEISRFIPLPGVNQTSREHYPPVMTNIAIEHCDLQWNYPLKIVMFHSRVSLPEDTVIDLHKINVQRPNT